MPEQILNLNAEDLWIGFTFISTLAFLRLNLEEMDVKIGDEIYQATWIGFTIITKLQPGFFCPWNTFESPPLINDEKKKS